jgi:hypothetical protein
MAFSSVVDSLFFDNVFEIMLYLQDPRDILNVSKISRVFFEVYLSEHFWKRKLSIDFPMFFEGRTGSISDYRNFYMHLSTSKLFTYDLRSQVNCNSIDSNSEYYTDCMWSEYRSDVEIEKDLSTLIRDEWSSVDCLHFPVNTTVAIFVSKGKVYGFFKYWESSENIEETFHEEIQKSLNWDEKDISNFDSWFCDLFPFDEAQTMLGERYTDLFGPKYYHYIHTGSSNPVLSNRFHTEDECRKKKNVFVISYSINIGNYTTDEEDAFNEESFNPFEVVY